MSLFKLSMAFIFHNLGMVGIAVTDTLMVTKLGETSMSAVGLVSHSYIFYFTLTYGIHTGAEALIAISHGKKNYFRKNLYENHALWISLIASIFGLIIMTNISGGNFNESIANDVDTFLLYFKYSIIPHYLFMSMRQVLGATKNAGETAYVIGFGLIANIVLNQFFIFSLNMGVEGAGLATLITRSLMFFILLIIFVQKVKIRFIFRKTLALKIFNLGFPSAINALTRSGVFTISAFYITSLSVKEMAGHILLLNLATLFFTIYSGYGRALSAIVGELFGKTMVHEISRNVSNGFFQVGGLGILSFVILYFSSESLFFIFKIDLGVQVIIKENFMILPLFFICDAVFWICHSVLVSMGSPKKSASGSTLLFLGLVLPMSLILIPLNGSGGFWFALTIGTFLMAIFSGIIFYKKTQVEFKHQEVFT